MVDKRQSKKRLPWYLAPDWVQSMGVRGRKEEGVRKGKDGAFLSCSSASGACIAAGLWLP